MNTQNYKRKIELSYFLFNELLQLIFGVKKN